MVEKLIIENFAGIKYLEIEVKKINIMIGPQASGKSVCAKLLFYFKDFFVEIIKTVENEKTKRQLDAYYSTKFKDFFPPKFWGDDDFILRYEINHHFIQISRKKNKSILLIDCSYFYKSAFSYLRKVFRQRQKKKIENIVYDLSSFNSEARSQIMSYFQTEIGKESTFNQAFIPAVRSFFAHLQKNIFSFLSTNNSLDPFINNFGLFYDVIKNIFININKIYLENEFLLEDKELITEKIKPLVEKILCGQYINEKGEDFLKTLDGRKISISTCSSGQQETLPLVIILSTMPFLEFIGRGLTLYIEEPEAHVFPTVQKNIVELIATVFNSNPDSFQFFITTHSPYILTATNNLLQAGLIYQDANPQVIEKLETIVPRYKALLTEDVAVYSLMDGSCQSIISEETGLIDTNIIDAVSEELAIEFDQLLELI